MTTEKVQPGNISPCLWFNNEAEEAVDFYTSVFSDSKIGLITRYDKASAEASGQQENSVLAIAFQINGQEFVAMNGGPQFSFSPAISFIIPCKDQLQIDDYWKKLSQGGKEEQCGWIRDKFGVSWQIVPEELSSLLSDEDREKAGRVMKALLKMDKIDLKTLEEACK